LQESILQVDALLTPQPTHLCHLLVLPLLPAVLP
jgi:hypothetical protein